ncbi:MAG: FHA domain-containing protein, partial [Tepidiformaceae bacterium]
MKFGVLLITDTDGKRREIPLDLSSLVVGRSEGNALIIDHLSISRRHARLTVDSGHLLVEDLGSAQGTFVNGVRIDPNVPNLVDDGSELRFGEIEVRYEPPSATEKMGQPGGPETDLPLGENLATASRLGITLEAPRAPVIAGAPWIATLRIHNRSNVVDRVVVSVPDLPAAWVRLERTELALPPGASEMLQLTIIPPRRAESLAGDYDFTVQVTSHEYQREASALATFRLAPFQNLALSFEAPRSKRDFRVVAENRGNEAATYTLEGEDQDAANLYEFELPAVLLQPGERRLVGLRVHHKTPLFGIPMALPFNVHAESEGPTGQRVSALGQLSTRPVLQKFVAPAMFAAAIGAIALVAMALLLLRSDSVVTTANAEAKFSGVHMCDKDEAAKAEARQKQEDAAVPKPSGGRALVSGTDPGAPYFAQNDPRWGKDEYARAKDPDFGPDWCGSTLEQCGCAMTSVTTTMALFGLLTMPDGSPLTPQAMNNWFNEEAQKTSRGWVSRGYIYGDVIWTAANQLSGEMAKARPGTPTIRFSRTGNGSDDEVREQLKQGRPIILEVPGHWIAAVGLDGDSILINDPYYRDRKTLDIYKGKVKSSVIFEPSDDLSAVVFTAPSDVRVRITDKQGRVVGSLATGTADEAAKGALNQIPGASYSTRQAWRDPSCIESAPPSDAGTNQIILPGSADDYKIEVLDAAGKPTSITIHTYDRQGKSTVQTIDNPGSAVAQLSVDPAAGRADVKVIAGAQPTAERTAATTGGAGGGSNPTISVPTATVAPTRPPAPTPTPETVVETNVSIGTIPGDQFVAIQNTDGFLVGDQVTFSPGKANEEDNRIVGFGSFILETPLKFAHSPGETIKRKPRIPGQGPGSGGALPPPVVIPPLTAPENLVLGCSTIYSVDPHEATLICTLDITGSFTTTRWSANGKLFDEFNNQQLLLMTYNSDGQSAVGVTVCNRTICKSTSAAQKIQFPVPGTTTGVSGGTGTAGAAGGAAAAAPTPPATGVAVNCNTQFEQGTNPRAVITCAALFNGPSTSISWTAPGAAPAAGQGKTFTTDVVKGSLRKLRVTATVCNFAVCQTSPNIDINIGGSTTKVFLKLNPLTGLAEVPLNSTTTFTAIVTGPPAPAGGTVQFNDGLVAVGPSVPLFTAGSVGFAQYTLVTGSTPLIGVNSTHPINAVYSGGTNLFGSFSADSPLKLLAPVPEVCNARDDNSDQSIDNGCDLTLPRDIGGGTQVQALTIGGAVGPTGVVSGNNSSDIVVRPGAPVTVTANLTRFPDCAGCIRQVYLAVGPNIVNGAPAIGPFCVFSGGVGTLLPGVSTTPKSFSAPSLPGIYYIRAASTLDFACVQATPLGPPDLSVGRIVVQAASTTSVAVTSVGAAPVPLSSIDLGTPVKITTTVSPAPAQPGVLKLTGTDIPDTTAFSAFVDANGTASFTFTPTTAGPHTFKATYFGFPGPQVFQKDWFAASTDAGGVEQPASLGVRTGSTTTLALTAGGAAVRTASVGTTITATVTVAPDDTTFSTNGFPVSLAAGGIAIPTIPAAPTLTGGTSTFTFVAGDAGVNLAGTTYNLVATFAGATYVAGSASGPTANSLALTKATSVTSLTAVTPNPIVAGDTLTLTAAIAGAPFASPDSGVVTFKAGSTKIATAIVGGLAEAGTCVLAPASSPGTASCLLVLDKSPLDRSGTYVITAEFNGTGTNLNDSSSPSIPLVVTAAPVQVTVVAGPSSTTVGGAGTLTITVTPSGKVPGPIGGTITLSGFTPLPASALALANPAGSKDGVATYDLGQMNAGVYTAITAHYDPDGSPSPKYAPADSPGIAVTITQATPVVTVTPPADTTLGTSVTLTANVNGGSALAVLSPAG